MCVGGDEEVCSCLSPPKFTNLVGKRGEFGKKFHNQPGLSKSNPNLGCPGAPQPWKWAALHETCSLEVAFRRAMGVETQISSWERVCSLAGVALPEDAGPGSSSSASDARGSIQLSLRLQ